VNEFCCSALLNQIKRSVLHASQTLFRPKFYGIVVKSLFGMKRKLPVPHQVYD